MLLVSARGDRPSVTGIVWCQRATRASASAETNLGGCLCTINYRSGRSLTDRVLRSLYFGGWRRLGSESRSVVNILLRIQDIKAPHRVYVADIETGVLSYFFDDLLLDTVVKDEALGYHGNLLEQLVLVDLSSNWQVERDGL